MNGLKIIKLQAENVKKLKAIDITPNDVALIKITGKCEQGKTTVLECITWALNGLKSIQEEPIRQGAEKGEIVIHLGDDNETKIVAKRTFTEKGSYLTVESEGAKFSSPQAMLDKLLGELSFDPLVFARGTKSEDKARRAGMLLKVVDLQVDKVKLQEISGIVAEDGNPLEVLSKVRNQIYEERSMVNRDYNKSKKLLESYGEVQPAEAVVLTDLVFEKEQKEAINRKHQEAREGAKRLYNQLEDLTERHTRVTWEIVDLEKKLAAKKQEQQELADRLRTGQEKYGAVMETINSLVDEDLTAINAKIAAADETNRKAQKYQEYCRIGRSAESYKAEADCLTAKLQAIDEYKQDMMNKADFPVDGLDFVDGDVYYMGLPFEQASGAQKIRVSLAVAMALNPKLKVILIDEGERLDSSQMAIIEEMASQHGYQIWMTVVDESGTVGVVIEDGEVKCMTTQPSNS